jgi:hypothetical protein
MRRQTKSTKTGYSRYAGVAAAALTLVLAVRLHEIFPQLAALRPGLLTIVGATGVIAATTPIDRFRKVWRTPPTKWLAAWVVWGIVTVPFAYYGVTALEGAQALVYGAIIFVAYLVTRPTMTNYHRLSLCVFAGTVVYGIGSLIVGEEENGRLASPGGFDPNDLAGLVALALPFGLALALRSKEQWKRLAALAGVTVLLVVLIKTASRGGFLALGVSSLVYVSGFRGGKRLRALMVAGVVGIVGFQFMDESVRTRVSTLFSIGQDYNMDLEDEDGRIAVWGRGISYAFDRPLTGVGALNFPEAEGRWRRSISNDGKWSAAHNSFIQILAELGFPGAVAYAAFVVGLFTTALRTWRLPPRVRRSDVHQPELLAALTSFTVTGMFLSHGYHHAIFALGGLTILGVHAAAIESRKGRTPTPPRSPVRNGRPRRVRPAQAPVVARRTVT